MLSIREILQRLGLSLRKGGGRRFCLPIIALLCAAALGSWFMMRPSEAEWTVNKSWYGDGTSSDFYISTSADLAGLAKLVNDGKDLSGKTIHLSADIDLGGKEWVPIGNVYSYRFSGTFDGGGHSVTGLYINSTLNSQGLFGYIDGAVIKDLSVSGSVTATAGSAGGIVGEALNSTNSTIITITNCASDVSVRGKNNVGGIAGSVDNATFTSCINRGDVVSEAAGQYDNGGAGGIAGNGSNAKFYSCANSGSVTAPYKAIGGIIGAGKTTEVRNCLNLGGVKTENGSAGGIVGNYYGSGDSGTSITLCTNMGSVQGATAGGIIGEGGAYNTPTSITSCASVGAVSGKYTSGAIAGSGFFTGPDGTKKETVNISNCVWYENGSVNAGLKSVGDDKEGKFTAAMAASADNYDNLAATYAPNPAMSMIPAGKTKTIFRSWPGTSADAVTEVSYDVLPATGLTLSADVNKSVKATMDANPTGAFIVGANASFTTSLVAGAPQETRTTNKMSLRVSEGWVYRAVTYVKPEAAGLGDGSSWTNAMSGADFSTMLKWISKANNGKAYEFRVAKGIYEQSETLPLPKGVKLYGGFAGNETSIESRSIAGNKTILSRADGLADDNKFSIVTGGAGATSADTRLDGFTITGGTGTVMSDRNYYGGGMLLSSSAPTIANCIISGNNAFAGGAMVLDSSSPLIMDCELSDNSALAGAIYMEFSVPYIKNCTVANNSGGGIYGQDASIIVEGSLTAVQDSSNLKMPSCNSKALLIVIGHI